MRFVYGLPSAAIRIFIPTPRRRRQCRILFPAPGGVDGDQACGRTARRIIVDTRGATHGGLSHSHHPGPPRSRRRPLLPRPCRALSRRGRCRPAARSARSRSRRSRFPLLRSKHEWDSEPLPPALAAAQRRHRLGPAPRVGVSALAGRHAGAPEGLPGAGRPTGLRHRHGGQRRAAGAKLLKGRSARVIVTMGMPAFVYRWYFGGHSLRSLERNILNFVGIAPVRRSLVGMVEGPALKRKRWLQRIAALGRKGT